MQETEIEELEKLNAAGLLEKRVRALAANIMRVSAGGGSAIDILWQCDEVIRSASLLYEDKKLPSGDVIAEWLQEKPLDYDDRDDDEVDWWFAKRAVIKGALRMRASHIVGQRTQKSNAESDFLRGFYEMENWRRMRRTEHATSSN